MVIVIYSSGTLRFIHVTVSKEFEHNMTWIISEDPYTQKNENLTRQNGATIYLINSSNRYHDQLSLAINNFITGVKDQCSRDLEPPCLKSVFKNLKKTATQQPLFTLEEVPKQEVSTFNNAQHANLVALDKYVV